MIHHPERADSMRRHDEQRRAKEEAAGDRGSDGGRSLAWFFSFARESCRLPLRESTPVSILHNSPDTRGAVARNVESGVTSTVEVDADSSRGAALNFSARGAKVGTGQTWSRPSACPVDWTATWSRPRNSRSDATVARGRSAPSIIVFPEYRCGGRETDCALASPAGTPPPSPAAVGCASMATRSRSGHRVRERRSRATATSHFMHHERAKHVEGLDLRSRSPLPPGEGAEHPPLGLEANEDRGFPMSAESSGVPR